jgi:hypothetical protein
MLTAAHVPDSHTYKLTGLCRRRLASSSGFPRTLNCSLFGHDQITSCHDEAVRLPKGALRGHLKGGFASFPTTPPPRFAAAAPLLAKEGSFFVLSTLGRDEHVEGGGSMDVPALARRGGCALKISQNARRRGGWN